jgi:serine/threonine protein kinase
VQPGEAGEAHDGRKAASTASASLTDDAQNVPNEQSILDAQPSAQQLGVTGRATETYQAGSEALGKRPGPEHGEVSESQAIEDSTTSKESMKILPPVVCESHKVASSPDTQEELQSHVTVLASLDKESPSTDETSTEPPCAKVTIPALAGDFGALATSEEFNCPLKLHGEVLSCDTHGDEIAHCNPPNGGKMLESSGEPVSACCEAAGDGVKHGDPSLLEEAELLLRDTSTLTKDNMYDDSDEETPLENQRTGDTTLDTFAKDGTLHSDASTCPPAPAIWPPATTITKPACHQCKVDNVELFYDSSDGNRYCQGCWIEYYGSNSGVTLPLVPVEVVQTYREDALKRAWKECPLQGWPPRASSPLRRPGRETGGDSWSKINVRVRRDVVGPHSREHSDMSRMLPVGGEVLADKYRIQKLVGEGHFTKAYLAEDIDSGTLCCVKRHRNLSIEGLSDMLVIGKRLEEQDPAGAYFPKLFDAFYDVVGFTVESLIDGRNCLSIATRDPAFFQCMRNLRHVAKGGLEGLQFLEQASVVHNDVKPDNIMWIDAQARSEGAPEHGGTPSVKLVDFGCARLDQREDPGRNWSLAEGGAGHLGKWSPEMALKLPITHLNDVWGLAISLCELYCGRRVWRNEADTAEVVHAQALGLCGLVAGVPSSLLRRSPVEIRHLYTPGPRHLPVRRDAHGQVEVLQPTVWGIDSVLGKGWQDDERGPLGDLLQKALVADPYERPPADRLLESCEFVQ